MKMDCIESIDITANNKDVIAISSDSFENFYIANVDDNGDETNYLVCEDQVSLFANFFMVKLLSDKNDDTVFVLQRLLKKKDIIKVTINFTNGAKQTFELAKRRIAHDGILENIYEDTYIDTNDNLCIMVTDKKIKYKKELFA